MLTRLHFKSILLIFTIILLVFFGSSNLSKSILAASDTGWTITNFHSDIQIHQDTTITVSEKIEVDFNNLQKHGIYRTIPVKYRTNFGNNLNIRLRLLSITDSQDQPLQVKTTREGDNVKFRIGDPDRTITGAQEYRISYLVKQVVTKPTDKAELYWNVTGTDWPVPILQASASVTAPSDSIVDTICFTGIYGTSSQSCSHSHDSTVAQFSSGSLSPGQGLTISTALNPSLINFPPTWHRLGLFLADNWIYGTPMLVFLIMFYLWYTRGRDSRYKSIFHEQGEIETVPLFERLDALQIFGPPKDLSPGEVGVLIDEKVHLRDITSIVIDLARRGFLTIKELPGKGIFKKPDFELQLSNKDEKELHFFETTILDMLFGPKRQSSVVKLSKLPKSSYKHLAKAQNRLYEHLKESGYFTGNPEKVRKRYLFGGLLIVVLALILVSFLSSFINPLPLIVTSTISGLFIVAFSFFMPARSAKGRKALKEVVGLREWIRLGAWREQIHEKLNFFEEVLPYTIAFGLTHKFINAFKSADLKDLSWYQSSKPLNIINFTNSMDSLGSSLGSGINATRPKSASSGGSGFGGGGFSGGGFGGGGGGSW
jgi:uncharacterized membrane protein